MNFEDFNYGQFNRFILVDVNKPKHSMNLFPPLTSKKTTSIDLNDLDMLGKEDIGI